MCNDNDTKDRSEFTFLIECHCISYEGFTRELHEKLSKKMNTDISMVLMKLCLLIEPRYYIKLCPAIKIIIVALLVHMLLQEAQKAPDFVAFFSLYLFIF